MQENQNLLQTMDKPQGIKCSKCGAVGGTHYKTEEGEEIGITLRKVVDATTKKKMYMCQFCHN